MLYHRFKESVENGKNDQIQESAIDATVELNLQSPAPQHKSKPTPFWGQLRRKWDNLGFQTKLALLLASSATIPVIIVTQGLAFIGQGSARVALEGTLQSQGTGFVNDYLLWIKNESGWQADTIADTVEAAGINLQNPTQLKSNSRLLQALVSKMIVGQDKTRPDFYKSFRIITDTQGKTVAQYIQTHANYSLDSAPKSEEIIQPFLLPTGINLGDVPIIKDALRTGRNLSGIELVEGKFMQRLGLEKQATVSLKPQPTQGLPEPNQPFPKGTYTEIDAGKTGLIAMAVQPIKVQGKVVGAAVVGLLLNNSHSVVDAFAKTYNSNVTLFAKDLRVSTTVPYKDNKTRATGTRAAREVAEAVLNQEKDFSGETNIIGKDYLTIYKPLYDYQKELNPAGAKPVGMAFVGVSLDQLRDSTSRQHMVGYSIGGGMLLLAGLVAVPIASSFARPLRRLAGFAQQVGSGEQGVRLEATSRQDEIGVLSQELNQMAAGIEASLKDQRQEAERAQIIKNITVQLAQFPQVKDIFNTAVQEIRLALKTDRVVVYGFNEKWQGTIIAESVAENWPIALGAQIDDPCFADRYVERYRKGRVQATANIYEANLTECHIKQLAQFAVQANLVAPIVQGERLLGLLIAHQCSAPRAWQQFEIDLFGHLATQVGFALDRASLLQQQSTAKEQLQKRAIELLMQVDPVSRGDLTIRASVTEDEIGTIADSYNATISSLRKIVTQVQAAAKQVTATTTSSEASASELSKEALRQAEEITTALDRIQEMSSSIRAVATSAELAEAAVKQANQTVEQGDAAMNRTVEGILAIRETVAQTSKKVKRLGESSQKISKVVNLIGTFADQTNLLALNASIEAANAGEQGRGFAVVAERVRALARQSALATAEIESLVKDIQTETNEVVAAMESGTEQVVEGTKLVDETRLSLNQITAASTQISALVEAISEAAIAQSQASDSVTQTISDVAMSAHQTSTEATLVSASFKELLAVATELQASASQFKVS